MTILLIDRDMRFRASIAAMLRAEGCIVQEYTQVSDLPPLDTLEEFSLVITDHTANDQNGLAFTDAFHKAQPSTPILLLTAYWSLHLAGEVGRREFAQLRRKPIKYAELDSLVRYLGTQGISSRVQSTAGHL